VIAAGDEHFLLSLRQSNGGVILSVQPSTRSQAVWQIAERVARKILGLDFPLRAFYEFAQRDPILNDLTKNFAACSQPSPPIL
jgi:hypothetical protein